MKEIFVSYRRSDSSDVTGRIFDHLKAQFGEMRLFKDVDSIPLGKDFRAVIAGAVEQCRVMLAVIGDDWLEVKTEDGQRRIDDPNDYVHIEIATALKRGIPIIPILVEDVSMPTTDDLPQQLRDLAFRNAIPVRSDPDFRTDIARLVKQLTDHVSGKQANIRPSRLSLRSISMIGVALTLVLISFCYVLWPTRLSYEVRINLPIVEADGNLTTTGNDSLLAKKEVAIDAANLDDVSNWIDAEVKKRFPRIERAGELQITGISVNNYPDDVVTVFWVYKEQSAGQYSRAMVSSPDAQEITYAFVGYPFFEPQLVRHAPQLPDGSNAELGVSLARRSSAPIILDCDDASVRSRLEDQLRNLGYDVHSRNRLNSLRRNVGTLNAISAANASEKFEHIQQSYVYVIVSVTQLNPS